MQQYRALYRENRPEVFSEVVGQEHIVKILRHQIATNTVSHAYLFCGTRGTGKTTTARLLAKAVNCTDDSGGEKPCGVCENCRAIAEGRFIDCIEIDAASNNGVDSIRELRESVNYPPSVGRKKVYIIDEVHMLSNSAFNALLKTLEEPPAHVMFILATTNPEKLPQTVLSRCMRMDFRRVPAGQIQENMRRICHKHGVEITDDALALLAANADGSIRDSLSLLEQCMSSGETRLDRDLVLEFLGAVSEEFYIDLTEKVLTHNISDAFLLLDQAIREGSDVRQLMRDWMAHYRSLLITKFVRDPQDMLNLSLENIEKLKRQADRIETDEINRSIVTLARTINDARYSPQARILMEVAIVTIASGLEYGQAAEKPGRRTVQAPPLRPAQQFQSDQQSAGRQRSQAERPPAKEPASVECAEQNAAMHPAVQSPAEQSAAAGYAEAAVPETVDGRQSREQLDDLWRDAFEEAEQIKPSLNVMRRAHLAGMNAREFKLLVDSSFAQARLESERDLICGLMEKRTGRRMKMVVRMEEDDQQDRQEARSLEDIARQAEKVLGHKVEIK